jgi:hypothetical protein
MVFCFAHRYVDTNDSERGEVLVPKGAMFSSARSLQKQGSFTARFNLSGHHETYSPEPAHNNLRVALPSPNSRKGKNGPKQCLLSTNEKTPQSASAKHPFPIGISQDSQNPNSIFRAVTWLVIPVSQVGRERTT